MTLTDEDKEAIDALAQAICDVFGPVFAETDCDEWNRLCREDRIIWDDSDRAVGVREL